MERRFVRGASMVPITMHIGKRMGSSTKGISISILRWRVQTKISQDYGKLSNANLSNADLFRRDLSQAKLIGANLVRANLSNAILEDFRGAFPDAIGGPDLMQNMRKQAARFGTKFIEAAVGSVDFLSRPFKINVGDTVHTADAVIIATGSSAMWLGLESERRLKAKGVSACSTWDG